MKSHKHKTNANVSPSLWRNHNYLLLQGGQLVSFIGDQQQFIALPLLVLALTRSAVQAGIAVSLGTIAVLVISPFAGVIADRWNRKQILVLCDGGRLCIILTLPPAVWLHVLTLLPSYVPLTRAGVLGSNSAVSH